MKGDFSRSTFREKKHYRKVNIQQGRVQLDSDWNEQNDIHTHYERAALRDFIGESGTVNGSTGFSIITEPLFRWDKVPGSETDSDSTKLKEFLEQNFNVYWIEKGFVNDQKTISTSGGSHSLSITLNDERTRATLTIDVMSIYEFIAKMEDNELKIYPRLFRIGNGHYYVDGILCENDADIDAFRQPDLPFFFGQYLFTWDNVPGNETDSDSTKLKKFLKQNFEVEAVQLLKSTDGRTISISDESHSPSIIISITLNNDETKATKATLIIDGDAVYEFTAKMENNKLNIYSKFNPVLPAMPGTYLAYLDVWERHMTAKDDPEILESALGGADTATRTKIAWQVKLHKIGNSSESQKYNCLSPIGSWDKLVEKSTRTLQARSKQQISDDNPCILPPGAGYRGLENQLYRVEIHDPGEPGKGATFKWSRDNGMVTANIKDISGNQLTVDDSGRDNLPGFAALQWVEVIDDRHELWGIPGTIVRLTDINDKTFSFDMDSIKGDPLTNENFPLGFNPKIRRWDSTGCIAVEIPAGNDGYIELEKDGIEVKFSGGGYKTGDYWLIPARAAKRDIEWPKTGDTPEALPAEGEHHFCRLAILRYDNGVIERISDCRRFFPSTTALNGLSANTGIITLHRRYGHDNPFGPFEHRLNDLIAPPAIILGLAHDFDDNIDFGDESQKFKVEDVNLKTFMVRAPPLPLSERELFQKLRWWAIPAQVKGDQIGEPVPCITFDPPIIRMGIDTATIRVIDPQANKYPLKNESVIIDFKATVLGIAGNAVESWPANGNAFETVDAVETDPDTGIFEVKMNIDKDGKTIHIGSKSHIFSETLESYGGFVVASYRFVIGTEPKTVTDVANIPKVGTGIIQGKFTDNNKNLIIVSSGKVAVGGTAISESIISTGNYKLEDVPPGDRDVVVSASGYNDATETVTVIANQTTIKDFVLTPATGTIDGKVKNVAGAAIIGATVTVGKLSAITAAGGYYKLSNVPVGGQTVKVSATGYNDATETVTMIANQTITQDFVLTPATGTIDGHVKDAAGNAIGATVTVGSISATTDGNGYYKLSNVPIGLQIVKASATGYNQGSASVTVTSGATVTQDFALTAIIVDGIISGIVTDDTSSPIPGATVTAGTLTATTNATGFYSITIAPGTYTVTATATGYNSGSASVTVTSGATVTQPFALTSSACTTGCEVTCQQSCTAVCEVKCISKCESGSCISGCQTNAVTNIGIRPSLQARYGATGETSSTVTKKTTEVKKIEENGPKKRKSGITKLTN